MRTVDVAIIGAGTAGLQAYAAARHWTDSIVLIEDGAYGTTCARSGCMPSKLLIAAAERAHEARGAKVFGIETGEVTVDGPAVMRRLQDLRDHFLEGVVAQTEAIPEARRLRGHARFREPGVLEVGGEMLRAQRIVIATGSVSRIPDQLREGAGARLLTIADLFELRDLPESVVVFGAGVIGVEAAQALVRLGVRVRCLSKGGDVAMLTDPVITKTAHEILGGEFPVELDAQIDEVRNDQDGVHVTFTIDGEARTETFERALVATGRVPNMGGLDIENAGLKLDEHGVPLSDRATCLCEAGESPSAVAVFIAGDAEGNAPVLPVASDDGRIAGDNAGRWPHVKAHRRKTDLFITYTKPSIATAGMRYAQIVKSGRRFEVGEASFADQGRAVIEDRARGLLRLYGEWETGILLGAELIAPDAEHHAHLLAALIAQGLCAPEALGIPFYHPCTEEAIRTSLRDLCAKLLLDDLPVERMINRK
ncbi:dihydrolipoyl dehydrogenase [Parvularcula dongshanensis]|uniref:Dihydrolipoamide dehydrogenase n=1 Tax=Parvularcula dongshanensis TaxID=1173995 RepID=A0A840I3B4_9PROT|nr:dihydrolipoyl dehydrogenase [Parvularcula dongshanensis]MBB4658763.1 dihydrolipoamide dehydrogenase [Parvularcula dongshanensis]